MGTDLWVRDRLQLILFCITVTSAVLIAHSSTQTRYSISLYKSVPPSVWGLLIISVVCCFSLIHNQTTYSLLIASLLSVILVTLPNIITGLPYGTDTFNKAGSIIAVLAGSDALPILYPGMRALAAVVTRVTGFESVVIGPKIAVAILSPFVAISFARAINVPRSGRPVLLAASVFLPLGFGVYLSTASTFHEYYLSLPIAILFVSETINATSEGRTTRRRRVTVLALGFVALLFHPLAFIFATALAIVIGAAQSGNPGPGRRLVASVVDGVFNVAQFVVPLFIYFLWFPILSNRDGFVLGTLSMLDLFQGGDGTTTTLCRPGAYINTCGVAWTGKLAVVVVLSGILIGLISTSAVTLLQNARELLNKKSTRTALGLTVFAILGLFLFATGIVSRSILIRVLPFSAVAALGALSIISSTLGFDSGSRMDDLTFGLVFILGVGASYAAFLIDIRYAALAILVVSGVGIAGVGVKFAPGKVPQTTFTVVAALLVVSVLIIYPSPATNSIANPSPGTDSINQYEWTVDYIPAESTFAAGLLEWRLHRYASYTSSIWGFRGSHTRYAKMGLQPGQSIVASGENLASIEATRPAEYIIHREYYEYHTPVVYEQNQRRIFTSIRVTKSDIEQAHPTAGRIYSNGRGYIWVTRQ